MQISKTIKAERLVQQLKTRSGQSIDKTYSQFRYLCQYGVSILACCDIQVLKVSKYSNVLKFQKYQKHCSIKSIGGIKSVESMKISK